MLVIKAYREVVKTINNIRESVSKEKIRFTVDGKKFEQTIETLKTKYGEFIETTQIKAFKNGWHGTYEVIQDDVTKVVTLQDLANKGAKEFKQNGVLSAASAKSCVWVYKFILRNVKTGNDTHTIEMVGAPSYELIGQKPTDLDWDINIYMETSTGNPQLIVDMVLNTVSNDFISVGFDSEITRI